MQETHAKFMSFVVLALSIDKHASPQWNSTGHNEQWNTMRPVVQAVRLLERPVFKKGELAPDASKQQALLVKQLEKLLQTIDPESTVRTGVVPSKGHLLLNIGTTLAEFLKLLNEKHLLKFNKILTKLTQDALKHTWTVETRGLPLSTTRPSNYRVLPPNSFVVMGQSNTNKGPLPSPRVAARGRPVSRPNPARSAPARSAPARSAPARSARARSAWARSAPVPSTRRSPRPAQTRLFSAAPVVGRLVDGPLLRVARRERRLPGANDK